VEILESPPPTQQSIELTIRQAKLKYNPTQPAISPHAIKAWAARLQSNTSKLGLGKARFTLLMLDAAQPLDQYERMMLAANPTAEEHTVVALILWRRLLPPKHQELVQPTMLCLVPLQHWQDFKDMFDLIRLHAGRVTHGSLLVWGQIVRKISNLVGRDLKEADWAQERARSMPSYANRFQVLSPDEYFALFKHCTDELITELAARVTTKRHPTIEEWWATRVASTPSGSSSWRALSTVHKTRSHKSADRPNKRVLYALLPQATINWATNQPPACHARTSTKPEPGRKRRALYAADDLHTIIASYASWGFEDAMRIDGMLAKQAPQDLLDWLVLHQTSQRAGGVWLSLDYSDFNKEHHWWEQAYLNVAIAQMWSAAGTTQVYKQKAAAALWVAASYRNRTTKIQGKTAYHYHGLFSGERNTARDNTLLHNIYKRMTLRLTQMLPGAVPRPVAIVMCGDDEDGWHENQEQAIKYYATGVAVGWHFNKVKQLLSETAHEFLQVMAVQGKTPTQPFAAAVVTFVTGNWYKSPILDLLSIPAAMLSTAYELIARGACSEAVFTMTRRYLNSLFKYHYGRSVRWDALLPSDIVSQKALNLHKPPVYRANVKDSIPIQLQREIQHTRSAGMRELIEANWDIVQHIPPGQRAAVIGRVADDIFHGWYATAVNTQTIRAELPYGHVDVFTATPRLLNLAETITAGVHLVQQGEPITHAQAAAIAGIPLPIYSAVDSLMLAKAGNPRLNGQLSAVTELPKLPIYTTFKQNVASSMPWLA
jgi:hypothetical protein